MFRDRIFATTAALFIRGLGSILNGESAEREAESIERVAMKEYARCDYERAASASRNAIEVAPDSRRVGERRLVLGLSLMHLNRCQEAMREFAKAPDSDFGRARCLADDGRWAEAKEAVSRSVRGDDPDRARVEFAADVEAASVGKITPEEVRKRAEVRQYVFAAEKRMKKAWGQKVIDPTTLRQVDDEGVPRCSPTDRRVSESDRPEIESLLKRALALDPGSPLANYFLACLHFDASWSEESEGYSLREIDEGLAILEGFRRIDSTAFAPRELEGEWKEIRKETKKALLNV